MVKYRRNVPSLLLYLWFTANFFIKILRWLNWFIVVYVVNSFGQRQKISFVQLVKDGKILQRTKFHSSVQQSSQRTCVIEHVHEPIAYLQKAYELLKTDGIFVLRLPKITLDKSSSGIIEYSYFNSQYKKDW